jgi:uncharacterized protein (DUF488 family)
MNIFTIGYAKKSAKEFFSLICANEIELLADVRLYNSTQLAGFAKGGDLQYFLSKICNCDYVWAKQFAPTPKLLDDYKNNRITWGEYEKTYQSLLDEQDFGLFAEHLNKQICLLCAEDLPEFCHRRLLAERVSKIYPNMEIKHL